MRVFTVLSTHCFCFVPNVLLSCNNSNVGILIVVSSTVESNVNYTMVV